MSLLVLLTSLVSQYYTTLYRQQDEHQAKALRMWDGENSVSWVEMYVHYYRFNESLVLLDSMNIFPHHDKLNFSASTLKFLDIP